MIVALVMMGAFRVRFPGQIAGPVSWNSRVIMVAVMYGKVGAS